MERVTTRATMAGFRHEDITYHGARRQSEILNELPREQIENAEPEAPTSTTPEQVVQYFQECIAATDDKQKKHVFSLAVKWILELEERKQKEIAEKIKAFAKSNEADVEEVEVE